MADGKADDMALWQTCYADRIRAIRPSAIRAMAKHVGQPGVVSFAAGAPHAGLFPYAEIGAAMDAIMSDPVLRVQALQYGASEGYQPLRDFIADLLAVAADEVIITTGSQQALDFVGKTFIDKGDRIITTSPTYIGALQAFGLYEPQIAGVPLKGETLDLARLEAEFQKGGKFFYVMPDHGNPSGTVLPLDQRHAVLELARRYTIPVIEDQAYDQLQLSGEPLPSLLSLDRASGFVTPIVSYLGTFSKSLTPGLRVGWIVAPAAMIAKLVSVKQASDLNSGTLNQIVVNHVARAALADHAPRLRDYYRGQRDAMLAALGQHMHGNVRWSAPAGGMFIWLTLPENIDATELQAQVFAEEKVIFVPGESFHPDGSGKNTLRLSYSLPSEEQIASGIAGLARVIKKHIQTN